MKEARLWVEIVDGGLSILDDEDRLTLDLCFMRKVKGSIDDLCERLNLEKSAGFLTGSRPWTLEAIPWPSMARCRGCDRGTDKRPQAPLK